MTFADAEEIPKGLRKPLLTRLAREAGAGVGGIAGIFSQAVGAASQIHLFPRWRGQGGDGAGGQGAGAQGARCGHPPYHRRRRGRAARRSGLDIIEALVKRDDELFPAPPTAAAGTASDWPSRPTRTRGVPLCDWAAKLARRHGSQTVRAAWSRAPIETVRSSCHKSAFIPIIRCSPARSRPICVSILALRRATVRTTPTRDPPGIRHVTIRLYDLPRSMSYGDHARFQNSQRLHGMGEEGVRRAPCAWRATSARRFGSMRRWAGTRNCSPIWCAVCWGKTGRIPASSIAWAYADTAPEELVGDSGGGTGGRCSRVAIRRFRCPRIFSRIAATAPGSIFSDPGVREPLMARLKGTGKRFTGAPSRPFRRQPPAKSRRSPCRMILSAVVGARRDATAEEIETAMTHAVKNPARLGRIGRRKARPAAGGSGRAVSKRIPTNFLSLCQREAGKTLLDAVLELREAVDFLRLLCARRAPAVRGAHHTARADGGRKNSLSLHGRGGIRHDLSVELPPGDLHRHGGRRAGGGAMLVIAKPAEQTPLIAALAGETVPRSGHPARGAATAPPARAMSAS